MIFIIDEDVKEKEGIQVIGGTNRVKLLEMLSSDTDKIVSCESYPELKAVLEFVGIDYKVVIGHPELPSSELITYEHDPSHIITFNEFKEKVLKVNREYSDHAEKLLNAGSATKEINNDSTGSD